MKRVTLELRRLRGALAYRWIILAPTGWTWTWWWALPAAGLYAHYDCDRANWREEGTQP